MLFRRLLGHLRSESIWLDGQFVEHLARTPKIKLWREYDKGKSAIKSGLLSSTGELQ